MGTSSHKSSSSSSSSDFSKQYLPTPSTTSKFNSTSSPTSQKVHPGSNSNTPQRSSSSSGKSSSSRLSHKISADQKHQDEAIKRYENEPRDYKSLVVAKYDAHQEQAIKEHEDGVRRDVENVQWAR
ncbi:hypothetical protein DSL72_003027 [Monilinia vaccinii-corymbosi]|uniref:Uncharacterized protein n=1 Tax=Monilinia vaccinii-corymbosi TaxID=61207 RepID=A0A8A3P7E9_9HELO|nr:hypothetical protein DSL72_003027 [Monilinia vaccinii-corymbosi]